MSYVSSITILENGNIEIDGYAAIIYDHAYLSDQDVDKYIYLKSTDSKNEYLFLMNDYYNETYRQSIHANTKTGLKDDCWNVYGNPDTCNLDYKYAGFNGEIPFQLIDGTKEYVVSIAVHNKKSNKKYYTPIDSSVYFLRKGTSLSENISSKNGNYEIEIGNRITTTNPYNLYIPKVKLGAYDSNYVLKDYFSIGNAALYSSCNVASTNYGFIEYLYRKTSTNPIEYQSKLGDSTASRCPSVNNDTSINVEYGTIYGKYHSITKPTTNTIFTESSNKRIPAKLLGNGIVTYNQPGGSSSNMPRLYGTSTPIVVTGEYFSKTNNRYEYYVYYDHEITDTLTAPAMYIGLYNYRQLKFSYHKYIETTKTRTLKETKLNRTYTSNGCTYNEYLNIERNYIDYYVGTTFLRTELVSTYQWFTTDKTMCTRLATVKKVVKTYTKNYCTYQQIESIVFSITDYYQNNIIINTLRNQVSSKLIDEVLRCEIEYLYNSYLEQNKKFIQSIENNSCTFDQFELSTDKVDIYYIGNTYSRTVRTNQSIEIIEENKVCKMTNGTIRSFKYNNPFPNGVSTRWETHTNVFSNELPKKPKWTIHITKDSMKQLLEYNKTYPFDYNYNRFYIQFHSLFTNELIR